MRYYGFMTDKTKILKSKNKTLTRILNIITTNGIYVDDHIWLDIKISKYKNEYNKYKNDSYGFTGFIEFEGTVDLYNRSRGSEDYEINIVNPVKFLYDSLPPLYKINYITPDDNKLYKYAGYRADNYYDLIDELQDLLNKITNYFENNFIFFYIINTITMSTAKENLYKNKLQRIPMSDKILQQIINTIASLIYELTTNENTLNINYILKYTTNVINILQNIDNYKSQTKGFLEFCSNDLCVNSRLINTIWNNLLNRKRNFGNNPNPFNLRKDDILLNASKVICNYIQ